MDRFLESAHTLGMKLPMTREEIRKKMETALSESGKKEAFVRLTISGGEIFVVVGERTHPKEMYEKGISLKTSTVRRNLSESAFPEAKSTFCLNQVLATIDPAPPEAYELLFLNVEGYVTEVRIGNIFMVEEGRLFTPPAVGLLNGVTRRFVIECARSGKIPVEEKPLTRHDLFNAEEAFLTNTSWEVLPIRALDGRQIGKVLPGPVTRRLQVLFREGVRREIRKVRNGKD